ncbi:hypothetical protein JVU11DRAFT_9164 [Chiua virens]|nr:hypothetical protein JVU11DRAFT_9164 [Chiua virens]
MGASILVGLLVLYVRTYVYTLPKPGIDSPGYVGFHPPYLGQEEDILSDTNIKSGFVLSPYVQTSGTIEAVSSQSNTDHVFNRAALAQLENIMSEVFARRSDNTPAVPPWTFKMPSRVTLNDAKRQAWFVDLADDNVPLHKLGKSVPHGARGHDLLDLLQSNNVAISRAIWFLRALGENETVGLRNKPNYNPTQYSIDWADGVTSYLKKQLAEIALPSAPRPGLNTKQSFKGVLLDPDSRDRWVSRFSYCLQLLRPFHADSLVDSHTFLVWLVQQMMTCNLAQAGFVVHLSDEYLDGVLASCALTKPFADPWVWTASHPSGRFVHQRRVNLSIWTHDPLAGEFDVLASPHMLISQRICIVLPDSFVSPNTWAIHSSLLASANALFDSLILRSEPQISSTLSSALLDIHRFYTRRQDAFGELHFGFLAAGMPILVSVEHNSFVPQYLRDMAQVLRVRTCESRQFRFAAYRDLDVIRRTFEQSIQSGSIDERLFEPLVNALKAILSDSSEDVNVFLNSGILSVLSLWHLAATAVQLQFGRRQIGRAMANDSTRQVASASLDKMTSVLFHHSEACFIAEMVKETDSAVAEKVPAFILLIDTLYFVIDELHSQSKTRTTDLFKYYPNMSENELPTDIPTGYYRQLFTFLPQLPPNKIVTDLVHAHRDISGLIVFGAPIQNRPWEWIENLGEPAVEEDAHRWQEGPFENTPSPWSSLQHAERGSTSRTQISSMISPSPTTMRPTPSVSRATYDRSRTGYPRRVSIDGIGRRSIGRGGDVCLSNAAPRLRGCQAGINKNVTVTSVVGPIEGVRSWDGIVGTADTGIDE